jgi:hypothetical protein
MHYISQRVVQLPPIVRDQCTKLFLFASSVKDGKLLAEEFGHDELEQCNLLVTGEYFYAQKMGGCKRINLFNLESRIDGSIVADRKRIVADGGGSVIGEQKQERAPAKREGKPASEGNSTKGEREGDTA